MIPYFSFPYIVFGPISIPTFPLALGLSIASMGVLFLAEARRKQLNIRAFFTLFFWWVAGTIVGARLSIILEEPRYFFENLFYVFHTGIGGGTEIGGIIGGFIFGLGHIYYLKLSLKKSLDAVTPGLVMSVALIRIGCGSIHDHLGKAMERPWPWGIEFQGTVRHEPSIYSLVVMLIIFSILWNQRERMEKNPGSLFSLYLVLYGLALFTIYFFREQDPALFLNSIYYGLAATQYIALLMVASGLYMMRESRRVRA